MMAVSDGIALHKRKSASRSATRRTTSATKLVATELASPGRDATPRGLIAHIDFPSSGLSQNSGGQISRPDIVPLFSAMKPMALSLVNSSLISSLQRDSISLREQSRLAYKGREAKFCTRSTSSSDRFAKVIAGIRNRLGPRANDVRRPFH